MRNSCRELQQPEAVNYWTDYLAARLHPASVWQLPGIFHGASDFSGYGLGRILIDTGQAQEEIAERVRLFTEECDSLQVMVGHFDRHFCGSACPNID